MWSSDTNALTPRSLHSWDVAPPKPKRRKIEVACETCRMRKSRCDGGRPKCGACMRRKNVPPVCVYSDHPYESRTISQPVNSAAIADHSTSPSSPPGHSSRGHTSPGSSNSVVKSPAWPSQSRTASELRLQSGSEDRDEDPPDDGTGDESNWILKAGLLAASSSTNFFNSIFGASGTGRATNDDPSDGNKRSNDWAASGPLQQPAVRQRSVHSAEYVLPARNIADNLLGLFFQRLYIPWIDRLRFLRWYEGLWSGDHEPEDSVDEQIHYANLNLIFALVYQTEPEKIVENQAELAQAYFIRAQKLLQLNVLELNQPDLLFALLLFMQWFQSVNNVRRCMSLVRLCIMIAHNLGLHVPGRIESLPSQRQREMARRAWHGCILMDRITAMISGQPLQISQEVARQSPLFAAIDDEYLGTGDVDGVQPAGKPPAATFFLAFYKLHMILGDVLTHFHGGLHENRFVIDVNHIIEVDDNLDCFFRDLPPQLRYEKDSENTSSYTGPMIHLHSRFLHIRIMLYRVFFLRAAESLKRSSPTSSALFADAVTHQGLLTCVRTAQEILELIYSRLTANDGDPHVVPQWWHTVTYIYTAATILIAAHIFPAIVKEVTASSLVTSILQGFQILDHHSEDHKSARQCKTALTVLCEQHVDLATAAPKHTPNGTATAADTWFPGPDHIDAAQVSADFGWDFASPSELFRGEGLDSLLFNTNLFEQETNEWL